MRIRIEWLMAAAVIAAVSLCVNRALAESGAVARDRRQSRIQLLLRRRHPSSIRRSFMRCWWEVLVMIT